MNWFFENWSRVAELAVDHLRLSLPAILFAVLIAVPLGRLAFQRPRIGGPLLSATALAYAIPALPLLIIIPVVLGIPLRSWQNMVIMLTIYGVALLVRSAADAFASVDPGVRAAAIAVGYSAPSLFWRVDLPLALPVLISGVRVVAVSTISLVTLGALIGVSSLGTLLTDGFQRGIAAEVWSGVITTVALALLIDGLILLAGRWLSPWARRHSSARSQGFAASTGTDQRVSS
ncbi:ABC transporter permease [Leucobacter coleopterorum]|uniref:ABC transporter permease n=1 Tax=Leucobacter coleopterorum TaxID=2714933 RepID=A0ABX6JZI4_9MICO|nr:ABC transporter permease [Leucobacter coleopterorum]QIM18239.1 ABC transporter permease [Leucobacter coleopterorum]